MIIALENVLSGYMQFNAWLDAYWTYPGRSILFTCRNDDMALNLTRIHYKDLDARQKENYNYQKLAAVLADYGFVTMRLSSDWKGADLIAQHIEGDTILVQLKARLTFCQKYIGKGLYIAFPRRGDWYLYPHDNFLAKVNSIT